MIEKQNRNKQKNPNQEKKKSSSLMRKNAKKINQSLEYIINKD